MHEKGQNVIVNLLEITLWGNIKQGRSLLMNYCNSPLSTTHKKKTTLPKWFSLEGGLKNYFVFARKVRYAPFTDVW